MDISWNERYNQKEYVYGELPNLFFADQLNKLAVGSIVLPCEGEGRNAVFAASKGWLVKAFDISIVGKTKATELANKHNVILDYTIAEALTKNYTENSVDVVAFIYAHFSAMDRERIHQKSIQWLKVGGRVVLEAFNTEQQKNNSGGPKDLSMLYTQEMIKEDFKDLNIELISTLEVNLQEGKYHRGKSNIIRFVGIKNR